MQQKATIIMHVLAEAHKSMDPSAIFNTAKDITTSWPPQFQLLLLPILAADSDSGRALDDQMNRPFYVEPLRQFRWVFARLASPKYATSFDLHKQSTD